MLFLSISEIILSKIIIVSSFRITGSEKFSKDSILSVIDSFLSISISLSIRDESDIKYLSIISILALKIINCIS
jgi:hypothetical protein